MEKNEEIEKFLLSHELYSNIKFIPNIGYCCVHDFCYTTGLLYGLTERGIKGRYCYPSRDEAIQAIEQWDGTGSPPGKWIVHKCREGQFYNPIYNRIE